MRKDRYNIELSNGIIITVYAGNPRDAIILGMAKAVNGAYSPKIKEVVNKDTDTKYSKISLAINYERVLRKANSIHKYKQINKSI